MKLSARLLALPLLAFGLLLSGCDSNEDDDNELPIEGNWEEVADQETPLYLDITSESITQYENYDPGECYYVDFVEIVDRDGDTYTLRDENGDTETGRIAVDGDELTIQGDGSTPVVFESTNVDPSLLERCDEQ